MDFGVRKVAACALFQRRGAPGLLTNILASVAMPLFYMDRVAPMMVWFRIMLFATVRDFHLLKYPLRPWAYSIVLPTCPYMGYI